MIKVKVINPTLDRNEPTFRLMMYCKNLLREYGIDITDSDDFDYMFIGMNDFINKKIPLEESIEWGSENVEKLSQGGEYFLFDGSDSTSLMGGLEVMRNTNPTYYIKNQLLQKEKYKVPSNFGRWFWGNGEFDLSYDITKDEWDKIKLSGWNLGHLQTHLFKDRINPINTNKLYDVCAIYQAEHRENYEHNNRNDIPYTKHRKGAWEVLDKKYISKKDKLPFQEYWEYLYNSRVCISPFGMGEVCFRDFESIATNTILIKPNMDIVITEPNIYIDKKTYFGVEYDWSNLNEVIDEVLSNFEEYNEMINSEVTKQFMDKYTLEPYCKHLYDLFVNMSNVVVED
jgi:hypothetical protein|tara:strand:+ start:684 stop:1709 length:1026 start_codon:yes stop_codon:yes gene_type:complete